MQSWNSDTTVFQYIEFVSMYFHVSAKTEICVTLTKHILNDQYGLLFEQPNYSSWHLFGLTEGSWE